MAGRPARIIVVDDQLAMAETVADGLADRGYDARAVESARSALAAVAADSVDVIISDLRMPGIDGLDLVDLVHVPVIIMTAYGAVDSEQEALRRGAFRYLTKPFKLDELAAVVDLACGRGR